MLLTFDQGAPIFWGIGNIAKRTYDEHPGRIVRVQKDSYDSRGRFGTVVTAIIQRTRLDGETYLSREDLLEDYVFDRDWKVDGLDDVALPQLVAQLSSQRKDFVQRGYGIEVGEPTPELASATVSDDAPGDLPF